MERETILRLKCVDCSFEVEFPVDTLQEALEAGANCAWDHLGKYDEVLSDHTVEGIVVYRYSNVRVTA